MAYYLVYNLKIYNYNSNISSSRADLDLSSAGSTYKESGKEGLSQALTFNLYKDIDYRRKIYEPNSIKLTVEISTSDNNDLPKLETIEGFFLKKPVEFSINLMEDSKVKKNIIASGFYIHSIKPVYKTENYTTISKTEGEKTTTETVKTKVEVEITLYSLDKLMTLNKYSQVYAGRKFREEILASCNRFKLNYPSIGTLESSEIKSVELNDNTDTIEVQQNKDFKNWNDETVQLKKYKKQSLKLQNLFYEYVVKLGTNSKETSTYGKNTDIIVQKEFIQPYLVQYNESFYDFITRVANRCGEFLYFEDGKLCIGLPLDPDATTKEISASDIPTIELSGKNNYTSINFNNISDPPLSVIDYARDSLKDSNTIDNAGTLNHSKTDPTLQQRTIPYKATGDTVDAKFPSDTLLTSTTETYYYNAELSADEFYMPLYKGGFGGDTPTEIMYGSKQKLATSFIAKVLAMTSLLQCAMDLIYMGVELGVKYGIYKDTLNERGENRFLKPDAPSYNPNPDVSKMKKVPDVVVPFSENNSARWTTLAYYSEIRNKEEQQQNKIVEIKTEYTYTTKKNDSEFMDFKLGDTIKIKEISENHYVVIEINTTASASGLNQVIKVIPLYPTAFDQNTPTNYRAFPPVCPGGPFRFSSPQTAFVVDAGDPKRQGRVRIRYPWQSNAKIITDEPYYVPADADYCKDIYEKYNKEKAEAASPWIRMATPSTSKGGGIYFEAEPGDEVLVDYDNGNVERPYVVGSLYSKNNLAPVEKSRRVLKSKYGHFIRFNDPYPGTVGEISDSYGAQRIFGQFFPLFDTISLFKKGDVIPTRHPDAVEPMTGGIDIGDAYGLYSISMSSDERAIKINSPFGTVSLNAFSGISINAPNGDIKISGKNIDINASNKLNITSGSNLTQGSWWKTELLGTMESAEDIFDAVYTTFLGDFQVVDLSMLRMIVDMLIRPIDGTLKIKSGGFLKLEAGEGDANPPTNLFSESYSNWYISNPYAKTVNDVTNDFTHISHYGEVISSFVDSLTLQVFNKVNYIRGKIGLLMNSINLSLKDIDYKTLITNLYSANATGFQNSNLKDYLVREIDAHFPAGQVAQQNAQDGGQPPQAQNAAISSDDEKRAILQPLNDLFNDIRNDLGVLKNLINIDKIKLMPAGMWPPNTPATLKTQLSTHIETAYHGGNQGIGIFDIIQKYGTNTTAENLLNPNKEAPLWKTWTQQAKVLKRHLGKEFLRNLNINGYTVQYTVPTNLDDSYLQNLASLKITINPEDEEGLGIRILKAFGYNFLNTLFNTKKWGEIWKDHTIWRDGYGVKGKVLISDEKGQTIMTDKNGVFKKGLNNEQNETLNVYITKIKEDFRFN